MLTIRNLTKRTVTFNLAHAFACSPTVCTCSRQKVGVTDHDRETGDRKVRAVNQRVPLAITLLPKGTKSDDGKTRLDERTDLLDQVARLPDVIGAKLRGEVAVEPTKEAKAEAPKAAAPPTGEEAKPAAPTASEQRTPAAKKTKDSGSAAGTE